MSSGLEKDYFMLALMTNQQLTMYKKFANRIICMDSTHNTNQYGLKLITLLVPDEESPKWCTRSPYQLIHD